MPLLRQVQRFGRPVRGEARTRRQDVLGIFPRVATSATRGETPLAPVEEGSKTPFAADCLAQVEIQIQLHLLSVPHRWYELLRPLSVSGRGPLILPSPQRPLLQGLLHGCGWHPRFYVGGFVRGG